MDKQPLVSVIVPTYNSAGNLRNLLKSCGNSMYKNFEVIINDDKRTNDNTLEVISDFKNKFKLVYIKENISMAQGRKRGADFASGDILLHLDSDMELTPELIGECIEKIRHYEYDALVVPEESFGTTFWARCKWLEKKCYEGVQEIESLRCVSSNLYEIVGGHDPRMVFSEDKDFDIRVRSTGARVGRTNSILLHNEGALSLKKTLNKKASYSLTSNVFAFEHPIEFKWQKNILHRYVIFLKNIKYLFMHPLTYLGMIFMKSLEYLFAAASLIRTRQDA